MDRRGFLSSILVSAMAPAIVRAESLMKLYVPSQEIMMGDWYVDHVTKTILFNGALDDSYPVTRYEDLVTFILHLN